MATDESDRDIVDLFCEITSIRRPAEWTADNTQKWGPPLKHMMELVKGNEYHFRRTLAEALNSTSMTVATPASIEAEFIKMATRAEKKVMAEPTIEDYIAYRLHILAIIPHALY